MSSRVLVLALLVGCRASAADEAAPITPSPAITPATSVSTPATPAEAPEPEAAAEPEEPPLSRPERQWRWISEAADDGCRDALAKTQARFHPLPDRAAADHKGCGIPRGVILRVGPTGLRYSPPVRVDCSFALHLARIETVLRDAARQHFEADLAAVGTLGSYVCRGVVGRLRGWSGGISEHSFGNAVDVAHFDLASGKRISVLRHFPRDRGPATTAEALFLRQVVHSVRRDLSLRALGPDFDASHRDHLHFDAGSRWWR